MVCNLAVRLLQDDQRCPRWPERKPDCWWTSPRCSFDRRRKHRPSCKTRSHHWRPLRAVVRRHQRRQRVGRQV